MTTDEILSMARLRLRCRNGTARAIRERAGLSQSEMASGAGTEESYISRWERGLVQPRGQAALRYAALLDAVAAADCESVSA